MKSEKNVVMVGVSDTERAQIAAFLRQADARLDHTWQTDAETAIDLVIVDLEQFAGRVARVRAMDERKSFAVLPGSDDETLGANLVLRRPLTPEQLIDVLNRSVVEVPTRRDLPEFDVFANRAAPIAITRKIETAQPEADAQSGRARFDTARNKRVCTDIGKLLADVRGAVLVERTGLPALVLDPSSDSFYTTAQLSELEPYFLDPIKSSELKPISGSRLADFRDQASMHPLARLRWLGALLGSNGWLASHLDPGGTYRVKSWISVDGDYRKQFRIATTMLRSAPLHQIAAAANATMAEVFDVVNAYDAVGLLEWTPRRSRYAAPAVEPHRTRHVERDAGKTMRRLLAATVFPR